MKRPFNNVQIATSQGQIMVVFSRFCFVVCLVCRGGGGVVVFGCGGGGGDFLFVSS